MKQPAPSPIPPYRDPTLPLAQRVADLLSCMTLDEKIAQLFCLGRTREMTAPRLHQPVSAARPQAGSKEIPTPTILFDEQGAIDTEEMKRVMAHGLCQLGRPSQSRTPQASARLTNAIQEFLWHETRLGIPALFNEEGLHGLMALQATSFPQAITLASTWNEALVREIYTAIARETRARGSNYIYTPVLDLARDPRWGRVEETFGEDPCLVARLGKAAVLGLQGESIFDPVHPRIDSEHVLAAAKHFAAHGQPEGGSNAAPGNISERVLREQFLYPFEVVVKEARVQALMASYNEIDGIPAHANPWLLQTVLRDEWGFEGFVTSDGFGVIQLLTLHHVVETPAQAGVLAVQAGVDCEVPMGVCYPFLKDAVENGSLPMSVIDKAVERILRAKGMLGLFDGLPQVDPGQAERLANCAEHRHLALEAARQGIILLKNEGSVLPLDRRLLRRLAVIGPNAADLHLGGYSADPGVGVTILDGIRTAAGAEIEVCYAEGCRISETSRDWRGWHEDEVRLSDPADDNKRIDEAVALAASADAVVVVIGENEATGREGWWFNHLGDRADLNLLGRQDELVARLLATGKPLVAVMINGRPLSFSHIAATVPAILEAWYPGQEGGTALAEILFGDTNPSGRLPVTIPRSVGHLPVYYYQKPSNRRGYLFETSELLFPFGYGLSYTQFQYANLRLSAAKISADESVQVVVDITNTGTRPGTETVQLYIHDLVSLPTRPVLELKDFQRVHLQPGETRTVSFYLPASRLAALGMDLQPCIAPGQFEILVGASSHELNRVILEVI
jgi:beta-glucosidase